MLVGGRGRTGGKVPLEHTAWINFTRLYAGSHLCDSHEQLLTPNDYRAAVRP